MLTKNLLKYTSRSGVVYPKYINPSDESLLKHSEDLELTFSRSIGVPYKDLETELKSFEKINGVTDGFKKLLENRCQFGDLDSKEIEVFRWDVFLKSRKLRERSFEKKADFDKAFAEKVNQSVSDAGDRLYSDLPENRKISSFKPCGSEQLIHRFNAAQIQGLLIYSREIRVKIKESDLLKRRKLFQKIKFHGLIASLSNFEQGAQLCFTLGGPLSIFDGVQSYSARLANFFPYLLHMKKWEIEADLKLNGKDLVLKSSSKKAIDSHYKDFNGYLPEDISEYLNNINNSNEVKKLGWTAISSTDVLNSSSGDLCFPDITLIHASGSRKHIEIFHKWHESQLLSRLGSSTDLKDLIVAYPKALLKKGKIKEFAKKSRDESGSIIEYSTFPTVKALLTYLN